MLGEFDMLSNYGAHNAPISGAYSTKSRRISKLFIQQTGTYNPQFRRSYEINLTPSVESKLEEAIANKETINPVHLVSPDQQLITPSADPESAIMIVNGWETPRLRFMMVIEVEDQVGTSNVTTIQGHTEYADLSMNNNVDPRMLFFINNVSQSRVVRTTTPLGSRDRQQVLASNQLIGDCNYHTNGIGTINKTYSMRPEDIFTNMMNSELMHMPEFGDGPDALYVDTRNHVTGQAKLSDRRNAIPGQYASTVLNTYLGCRANDQDNESIIADTSFYDTCSKYVANAHTVRDEFMTFIENRRAGFMAMNNRAGSNTFTYEDLLVFDPNVRSVTHVIPNTNGLHQMGQTASWGGTGPETLFAASIASAIAGAMHQNNISMIAFKSSNMVTFMREITTIFTTVKSTNPGFDMTREIQGFKFQLENIILYGASYGGTMGFSVDVTIDLAGDTWINVSLEGMPEMAYVVPTFCDSLMAPVVTLDRSRLDTMTMNLESLGNTLHHHANTGSWQKDSTIYSWGTSPKPGVNDI